MSQQPFDDLEVVFQIHLRVIQHGATRLLFRGAFGPRICEEFVSGTTHDVEEQCGHHLLLLLRIRTPCKEHAKVGDETTVKLRKSTAAEA